jgi:hypothetical protein
MPFLIRRDAGFHDVKNKVIIFDQPVNNGFINFISGKSQNYFAG